MQNDIQQQFQQYPAKALCIDDEPLIRDLLRVMLSTNGYEVVVAGTGEEALSISADDSFDIILLDLRLPDISGIDICARIRENSAVPIIMMSGQTDSQTRAKALDAGSDDFVTKPFDRDMLLAKMRSLLRINRLRKYLEEANQELQAAYESSKDAESRYLSLINDSLDAVFVVGKESGVIREVNSSACALLEASSSEIIGKQFSDFCPENLNHQGNVSYTTDLISLHELIIPVLLKQSNVCGLSEELVLYTIRDLTPWKRLEVEHNESERLAAIVETAIAVNEEVNSPLSVIINNAESLKQSALGLDSRAFMRIELILGAARKIQEVTLKLIQVKRPASREYLPGAQMLDLESATSSQINKP
jgi:CheY-like chemotaxis protein